jgi:hypothetical protein
MPAVLTNDRFSVQISVVGYEFPDSTDSAEDANWLIIGVRLELIHGAWRWQVEDAGALTWELDGFIAWLRALSADKPVESESFGFSEPDISFDVLRGDDGLAAGLALHLMDEFQPPTKVLIPRIANVVTLRFFTPPEVLAAFADGLAEELARFPQRGPQP